jgi:hypothetical protein
MSDRIGLARCCVRFPPSADRVAADPIDDHIDGGWLMNEYIYRLSVVHRKLDEEIRREIRTRVPDTIRLLRLKKLRLAVKDRIADGMRSATSRISPA